LRCCCHDQPSLVGDPRSLIGRHHSLLLARDVLHAIDHAVRVDLRAGGGVGAKGPFFYRREQKNQLIFNFEASSIKQVD
jgi:hypothetical protein